MGLFARKEGEVLSASERIAWTREVGTRKLFYVLVAIAAVWLIGGKAYDTYLLRQKWSALQPEVNGLTVVGTLDGRGNYDRNLFRILQANQTSRVELTDYGWREIFASDTPKSPILSEQTGNIIRSAISVDGVKGYAMLEPFIRYGVALEQKTPNAESLVSENTPVHIEADMLKGKTIAASDDTLKDLIDKFKEFQGLNEKEKAGSEESDNGGGHDMERGLAIPATSLARTCPVVLTGRHFNSAELEEHPASVLQGKTYTLHLGLTSEGRSRFYQWSRDHANESLVLVLGNEIAVAGRVAQTLDVNEWQIGPLPDADSAQRLVKYINEHKK